MSNESFAERNNEALNLKMEQRRIAEDALRECEERRKEAECETAGVRHAQQVVLDHFPGVALLLRPTTREVVAANQAGIDVGAVCGSKCFETWGQSQVPCPWCLASNLWATGEEQQAVLEAGGRTWEAHWVPVADDLYLHYALDITQRSRSEGELQEKDQLIQQALSISNSFTFDWDIDTDRVHRSDSCRKLFGIDADEMCNATAKRFSQSVHPDDRQRFETLLHSLTPATDTYTTEYRLMLSDATMVTLGETAQAFFDADGKMKRVIGVATDTTKRQQAEGALRQSQETFSELVERSPFGTYIVDSDFRIAHMNASSQNGAFRNVRPVIGRDFSEAMHILWPDSVAEGIITVFRHTLETGEPYYSPPFINPRHDADIVEAYEWELHRMTLPDGQYGVICYYFDSTKLREAEAALREARDHLEIEVRERTAELTSAVEAVGTERQRLFDVLETLPAMICLLTPDHHVPFANRAFREKFGEPQGRHCYDFCFGNKEPCDFCQSYEVLKTGKPHHWEVTSPDGSTVISAHDFPFTDVDGSPLILEMDLDITEQRQAESELKKHRDRLEEMVRERTSLLEAEIEDHKQAEEALRESEEKFRLLVSGVEDYAIFFVDPEGRVSSWNEGAERIKGYSTEEIIGKPISTFYTPEDIRAGKPDATLARARREGRDEEEALRARKDGSTFWAEIHTTPLCDDDGRLRGYAKVLRDITDRKRAEEQLQSAAQFPEENPNPVLRIGSDGHVLYTNVAARELLSQEGWESGKAAPLALSEPVESALRSDQVGEFDLPPRDGRVMSFVCVPISGRHYANLYGRDITERKQAEEALRESEDRFRTMADAIPQLAWMADPDGYIFWYNERWYEYTGTTPEQMEGWGWQSVHNPATLPSVLDRWKNSIATGDFFDMEFPLLGADGKFRPFLTRVMPLRDSEGRVVRWFGTNTDVSEARELEAHKRDFYRRTILAATSGKLEIVEPEDIRALHGDLVQTWRFSTRGEYSSALTQSFRLAESLGFAGESLHNFMSCAGEMLGNAQKHAGGGEASFYRADGRIFYVVSDAGPGIDSLNIPDVALVRGYTTAGTGGMGYKLIIGCADKTYLATGPSGTMVAVEMSLAAVQETSQGPVLDPHS